MPPSRVIEERTTDRRLTIDPRLTIDSDRLTRELDTLASLTDAAFVDHGRAVTRVLFSSRDLQARAWLKQLASEAGLSTREDAVGNLFVRLEGDDPSLPAIATGSHIDAIPHAGMYDGTVGVLGGIEALRAIQRSGLPRARAIEVVMLTAEEPTRFGIGCLGSRLLAGAIDPERADALKDASGATLRQAREEAGCTGDLSSVRLAPGHFGAWIELHIEQGPLLERDGLDLGIVTDIAAPASSRFVLFGFGGHAGALLMPDRRDALCAAAELVLAIEQAARASGSVDTVATVGACEVFPGAVNSVPSKVALALDLRDTDPHRREAVMRQIRSAVRSIADRRDVRIEEELLNADPPATSSLALVDLLESCAQAHGARTRRMVSRAYHDTLFLAQIAPVAMLFIPCRGGVSHRPDEYASPEAIALGAAVLAEALVHLAAEGGIRGISPEGAQQAASARAILSPGNWPAMPSNSGTASGEMP